MTQDMPESYRMASGKMRKFFDEVNGASKELLQKHRGLTSQQAEHKLGKLFKQAFERVLFMAMCLSCKVPVQPDWLMYTTTIDIKIIICYEYCNGSPYPKIQGNVDEPKMYNRSVLPSPEHVAKIRERTATQAIIFPRKLPRFAERQPGEMEEFTQGLESIRAPGPIQVNQSALGSQTSLRAGRGDPSSTVGTAPSCSEADQELAVDAQEILGYNSLACSTVSTRTGASEVSLTEAQAIQDTKRAEEQKRATELAKARKMILQLAKKNDDSDPVLDYKIDVPDSDPDIMAILWDAFEVAEKFPTSEGFTCSGRQWEVMVLRSSAIMFFGDGFCHKDAILEIAEKSGTARIYACFEDQCLHIGVTTQKNTLSMLGDQAGVEDHMHSAKKIFDLLAAWARSVNLGGRQSFISYRRSVIRQELESMGINLNKSSDKSEGEEMAAASTSVDEEEGAW